MLPPQPKSVRTNGNQKYNTSWRTQIPEMFSSSNNRKSKPSARSFQPHFQARASTALHHYTIPNPTPRKSLNIPAPDSDWNKHWNGFVTGEYLDGTTQQRFFDDWMGKGKKKADGKW